MYEDVLSKEELDALLRKEQREHETLKEENSFADKELIQKLMAELKLLTREMRTLKDRVEVLESALVPDDAPIPAPLSEMNQELNSDSSVMRVVREASAVFEKQVPASTRKPIASEIPLSEAPLPSRSSKHRSGHRT